MTTMTAITIPTVAPGASACAPAACKGLPARWNVKTVNCNWSFLLWIDFCFALICLELMCGVHCVNDISPLCVIYRVLLNYAISFTVVLGVYNNTCFILR